MRNILIVSIFLAAMISLALVGKAKVAKASLPVKNGGINTLYALDPLSRTLSFTDGQPGGVFQENEVKNRDSHIDFGNYHSDSFTVGIQGGQTGKIVDLGSSEEMAKKYGYEETVGGGQGYASLQLIDGKMVILKNRKPRQLQELQEGMALLDNTWKQNHLPVKIGHLYLARVKDSSNNGSDILIKLMVIEHRPNEQVTVRWDRL